VILRGFLIFFIGEFGEGIFFDFDFVFFFIGEGLFFVLIFLKRVFFSPQYSAGQALTDAGTSPRAYASLDT